MYRIMNKMVTLSVKEVSSLKEKITGLIGKNNPYNLMFKTHFGIHTFGLKFPIDVLILNDESEVVAMKKDLKPNRIYLWNPIYERVIELPNGTVDTKKIKLRDPIDVKFI